MYIFQNFLITTVELFDLNTGTMFYLQALQCSTSFIEALLIFDTYMYEYGPISNTVALILLILELMYVQEDYMMLEDQVGGNYYILRLLDRFDSILDFKKRIRRLK